MPGQSQMNPEAVRVVRFLAARGVKQTRLAKAYGVSKPRISRIVTGKIWREAA